MGRKNKKSLKIPLGDNKEYVTIEETADFLRLSEATVRKLIEEGHIKTKLVEVDEVDGHAVWKTRIVRKSVADYINANGENE